MVNGWTYAWTWRNGSGSVVAMMVEYVCDVTELERGRGECLNGCIAVIACLLTFAVCRDADVGLEMMSGRG